ncbi:type IV secretory system conjugative DNA transfer family protein [Bradyrhizobium sp. SZCCHNRI1029]|uniref:type IV secretory system conjugative DNA transfer family protein n=1 Tax=Bradyrhizobium sp. SZCCHNRI1029 TaxID=3057278 RepID=UPI0039676189
MHWDGDGHLLTLAPTRSGKSVTTIIPNLLRYRGSAVFLDPKGDLYEATSAWRPANVGPSARTKDLFGKVRFTRMGGGARA